MMAPMKHLSQSITCYFHGILLIRYFQIVQNQTFGLMQLIQMEKRGYVADPTLFHRLAQRWHPRYENATYWDRLHQYQSHLQFNINHSDSLTMDEICSLTERNGGAELSDVEG